MNDLRNASGIEIKRVWRVPGQHTTLRLELAGACGDCVVSVRRALNPTLFDFIARQATLDVPVSTSADGGK